jgi:hypothetical protein
MKQRDLLLQLINFVPKLNLIDRLLLSQLHLLELEVLNDLRNQIIGLLRHPIHLLSIVEMLIPIASAHHLLENGTKTLPTPRKCTPLF